MCQQAKPFARSVLRRARGTVALALAATLVLTSVGERGARADSVSDLEKAHNAYVAHRYDDAANRLRALLDPRSGSLKEPDNVADARMYLGAALLAVGKKADADAVFQQLLLSFESILPLRLPSEFRDPKVHQRILNLSEGVLVRICRLIETAAVEAIRSGQEQISLALLKDDLVTESLISIADRRNRRVSSR